MVECPEVIVYHTRDPRVAPFVARFWQAGDFLPMIFSGDTVEAVERAARQFWSDETAKIEAKRLGVAKARAARHVKR